ncbi:osmoprotectant transport system permease protein [Sediminihabitans luteus]|uniref:Osmoprotectant transport system permease protein n=1 Tax=Sediminihabitans luteus TaxID=1138585 RepID=A0A2M9CY67_9CELL|nr:ABC transporter permease subunit [Sediminihabitans luteus]PJJ76881.1 osmoprotectant transport system permease protein [Sediminihabitans luteus]GIJ00361.1 ABC transporter permease [Sediminihabitans luteus]
MSTIDDALVWLNDPYNWTGPGGVLELGAEHLRMTAAAVGIAAVLALPLGVWLGHTGRGAGVTILVANSTRAVPTFGIILILATTGLFGNGAAIIAAAVFAFPVILANTFTGVHGVDRDVRDAARGMGMSGLRIVGLVELPLAVPLIAAGLRTTIVQVVATIPLAAVAGGGGLGQIINFGIGNQRYGQVLAGGLIIAALALVIDLLLGLVQRAVTPSYLDAPRGGRRRRRTPQPGPARPVPAGEPGRP